MRNAILAAAVLWMAASVPAQPRPQSRASAEAAARPQAEARLLAHSFRRPDRNGWIYVHLEGTPEQLGFQNGYWLAPEIQSALETFHVSMPHDTERSWAWLHRAALDTMLPHIEAQYRQELEGIVAGLAARGVHADLGDVILLNAFEELPDYYVPWYNDHHGQKAVADLVAPGNCSAFIATGSYTRDGKIVIGHNAWTSYYKLDELLQR